MKKNITLVSVLLASLLTGCGTMQHRQVVSGDLPKPGEIIKIVYTADREGDVVILWEPAGTREIATFSNTKMVRTERFNFSDLPINPEPEDLFLVHKDTDQIRRFERIGTTQ